MARSTWCSSSSAPSVGTITLTIDGVWRRPTWVHLAALDVELPADAVTLFGRDLAPIAAPPLAVLERFDPKWIAVRRGDGGYTLVVDDDVDGVVGATAARARQRCVSSSKRPRRGRSCTTPPAATQWRAPNQHLPVPARLRTVDEPVHARLQWIPDAAPVVAKAQVSRRAARGAGDHRSRRSVDGAHAGGAGLRTQRPAVGDDGPPGASPAHHQVAVRARHRSAAARETREVVALADSCYVAGSEIVPHSATPKRDERPVTMAALDTFARWHARTWIDHQPETNCEAFGDQGFRSSGKFAIADLLAAHGYDYVWAEVDLEPGPLNLLRADRLGQRAPTVWPIGRLDLGGPSGLWMFRSQWAFLEAKHFYNMYSAAALDRLERERGLHIAHTYLETYHPPHTKFGMKNLIVPVDPHEKPGGSGPVKLAPEFERLLASLQARQERGTLWMPTLAALGDRLRAMADVKLTVGRRSPRAGADARRRSRARPSSWRGPTRRCGSTASCRAACAASMARRPSGPTCRRATA